jgi:hypothetical protein
MTDGIDGSNAGQVGAKKEQLPQRVSLAMRGSQNRFQTKLTTQQAETIREVNTIKRHDYTKYIFVKNPLPYRVLDA